MSEKIATKNKAKKPSKRATAAAVMAGLSFFGGKATNAEAKIAPDQIESYLPSHPTEMKNPDSLPGKNIRLNREVASKLVDSTVSFLPGYKEYDSFSESCTATVRSFKGVKYVVTTTHCAVSETGVASGAFNVPGYGEAFDLYGSTQLDYAIGDPNLPFATRVQRPLGYVTNFVVSNEHSDITLMKVEPSRFEKTIDDIPALEIPDPEEDVQPVPGQEVALFGVPGEGGFEPIAGHGTYLGTMNLGDRLVYMVGYKSQSKEEDACFFGGSGGSFATNDAKGRLIVSGGATVRVNKRYDPKDFYFTPPPELKNSRGFNQVLYNRSMEELLWDWYQRELGVDVSRYTTLCGFTKNDGTLYKLINHVGDFVDAGVAFHGLEKGQWRNVVSTGSFGK